MRFLHTSDWHLGRTLYGRPRYAEFSAFLAWLTKTITQEKIDVILIAGDIFDTKTPSNRSQELYYKFLCHIASSGCRHIVIVAGNHDSPSFLNAPQELLKVLNVHVIGAMTDNLSDEIVIIPANHQPSAIICAVPYLRDKDIRIAEPGETIDDKNSKLVIGIKNHYAEVCAIAEQKRAALNQQGYKNIPIIAMGHLFTAGGKTIDDDGVRELYVGTLIQIEQNSLPTAIDYFALGHLHIAQSVNNTEHIRYCGSPIPMGFSEAQQGKKLVIIDLNDHKPHIQELPIPCFQQLVRIKGDLNQIQTKIKTLKEEQSNAWLEIEYNGTEQISDLREQLENEVANSSMEIIRIKNRRLMMQINQAAFIHKTLDELGVTDVFQHCLEINNIPEQDCAELMSSYQEVVNSIYEEDLNKE